MQQKDNDNMRRKTGEERGLPGTPILNKVQGLNALQGGDAPRGGGMARDASPADARPSADAEFARWMAKYGPVERAIMEARARRLEATERRRMRRRLELAAECEATEGLAKTAARRYEARRDAGNRGRGVRSSEPVPSSKGGRSCGCAPLVRIGGTGLRVLDGGILSVLLSVVGVVCTRELDTARHMLKRPLYYERENARRRMLAAERRKVRRRTTLNPCPTREEVLDAWIHVGDSREAMLRFGGMIEDLECHVDNALRFGAAGEVVGRGRGVKGWLQENIPALWVRYKTVMRYKAAAKKLRQIVGLRDPAPLSSILDGEILARTKDEASHCIAARDGGGLGGCGRLDGVGRTHGADGVAWDTGETENETVLRTNHGMSPDVAAKDIAAWDRVAYYSTARDGVAYGMATQSGTARAGTARGVVARRGAGCEVSCDVAALRARAVYLEAMESVPDNATRTIARLDELLDPERVEDATMLRAWKERYANEITERTKVRWLGKLFDRTG